MRIFLSLMISLLLSACDYFDNSKLDEFKNNNQKAVGAGCRQSGKSLEDCFQLNEKTSKALILNGWKEMDIYMRENNLNVQKFEPKKIIEEELIDVPGKKN